MHTTFFTPSGKTIDLAKLSIDMIDIQDIAQALSYSNRYNGFLGAYSVAQHSIHVSERCAPEWALEGLMHDGAEAYVGDLVSPLKNDYHMDRFRNMEGLFTQLIDKKFGLMNGDIVIHHIDVIDKAIVRDEVFSMATPAQKAAHCKSRGHDPDEVFNYITPWPAELVRIRFLDRFYRLMEERGVVYA